MSNKGPMPSGYSLDGNITGNTTAIEDVAAYLTMYLNYLKFSNTVPDVNGKPCEHAPSGDVRKLRR